MINIFSRINKQLASWIAFWQFLRGLDRYTLNVYQDLDGRVDLSEDEPSKKVQIQDNDESSMQEHRNDKIIVRYDPNTCIHAGKCVRGPPPSSTSRRARG